MLHSQYELNRLVDTTIDSLNSQTIPGFEFRISEGWDTLNLIGLQPKLNNFKECYLTFINFDSRKNVIMGFIGIPRKSTSTFRVRFFNENEDSGAVLNYNFGLDSLIELKILGYDSVYFRSNVNVYDLTIDDLRSIRQEDFLNYLSYRSLQIFIAEDSNLALDNKVWFDQLFEPFTDNSFSYFRVEDNPRGTAHLIEGIVKSNQLGSGDTMYVEFCIYGIDEIESRNQTIFKARAAKYYWSDDCLLARLNYNVVVRSNAIENMDSIFLVFCQHENLYLQFEPDILPRLKTLKAFDKKNSKARIYFFYNKPPGKTKLWIYKTYIFLHSLNIEILTDDPGCQNMLRW